MTTAKILILKNYFTGENDRGYYVKYLNWEINDYQKEYIETNIKTKYNNLTDENKTLKDEVK